MTAPMPAAVLGAGLIGTGLADLVHRSPLLDCALVVARDAGAAGLRKVADAGITTTGGGIRALLARGRPPRIVFDATDATAHAEHAELLRGTGTLLVDLTPSNAGHMVVPGVNDADALAHPDLSMISCGGQAVLPLLHAITRANDAEYIEVVTTAAGPGVGRATRLNLDEYVATTQEAVTRFTGVKQVKALLNISPARPPATFRVAVTLLGADLDEAFVSEAVLATEQRMRTYVPGYRVAACVVGAGRAFVAVEVSATGGRIPAYAGNLEIINSAAVRVAELYAGQA
ncbi:hypothetical protein Q5425_27525 [Amycolatopsis sp. A133]|uniref:acetylating acetaldehyde dehydrogenase n=1 Tax=Amycolatopsis sp. A133 TaxID=3064472 RepID=UPI0027E79F52|nr:hypothetical protein [Amycolatopsis sp. A133]MDQ7807504.1 hypothetical protein [Amycolatopsis sp. A133]